VALAKHGESLPVAEVMSRDFQVADSSEMLENVFGKLYDCKCHTVPVVHGGRLVGLATMENLGEFMMIQSALSGRRNRAAIVAS
jgi:CBS-domain-containing membrane protein